MTFFLLSKPSECQVARVIGRYKKILSVEDRRVVTKPIVVKPDIELVEVHDPGFHKGRVRVGVEVRIYEVRYAGLIKVSFDEGCLGNIANQSLSSANEYA